MIRLRECVYFSFSLNLRFSMPNQVNENVAKSKCETVN